MVLGQPGGVGRLFRGPIGEGRIRRLDIPGVGQVVKPVIAGSAHGLEDEVAVFAIHVHARHVSNAGFRACGDHQDLLLLRFVVSPPPGNVNPHRVGGGLHADDDPMRSVNVGVPGPRAVANLLGAQGDDAATGDKEQACLKKRYAGGNEDGTCIHDPTHQITNRSDCYRAATVRERFPQNLKHPFGP